jgi:hypothetical protein
VSTLNRSTQVPSRRSMSGMRIASVTKYGVRDGHPPVAQAARDAPPMIASVAAIAMTRHGVHPGEDAGRGSAAGAGLAVALGVPRSPA